MPYDEDIGQQVGEEVTLEEAIQAAQTYKEKMSWEQELIQKHYGNDCTER